MKIFDYLILIVFLFSSCNVKNKQSEGGQVPTPENEMKTLIRVLIEDTKQHKDVEPKLTDSEIQRAEKELGITLPNSYKLFLKEFGNGAYWLYTVDQPINGVNKEYGAIHRLGKFRNYLGDSIQSNGFGTFKTNSLLCLMTENSNGGAWVWITSETSINGEWPLAYYSMDDQKLYFKVENFLEWIRLATKCKYEVIRELDKEYILNLG